MIKYEYRSFLVKNGTEDAKAEYQQVFGYKLVSCSYSLGGVRMTFKRDLTSPLYPLWRREEKLHYHLLNDESEIQKEINYVHRKVAFPSVLAFIFWLIMLVSLGVLIWMIFVKANQASAIEGSDYFLVVSILTFVTALIIYVVLVVSHHAKWVGLRRKLEEDRWQIAKISRQFLEDLAKSNKVPEVPFDQIRAIEERDKLGPFANKEK
ncbi:MAG: hypothetical protein WCS90_02115 [Bacilli bacterium]